MIAFILRGYLMKPFSEPVKTGNLLPGKTPEKN
jgi:hypothetical protein